MHDRARLVVTCVAVAALCAVVLVWSHGLQAKEPRGSSSVGFEAPAPQTSDGTGPSPDLSATRVPILNATQENLAILTVVDDGDRVLEGALVHVRSGAGWTLAGTTSTNGSLLFEGGHGIVRHPGYQPGDFDVSAGRRKTLVLETSGAIDGIVSGLNPAGLTECTIVARQASDGWMSLVEDVESGSPRVIEVAGCRPDGSFRLTGVRPGREYFVEGSVRGMASPPVEVKAGTLESPAHVVVEMLDVWGAQVVFVGPGGQRLHCPDQVDVARSRPAKRFAAALPPGFKYAKGIYGLSEHRLSGGAKLGMVDGRYRALIEMTPESGSAQGPANVSFSFQLPGYEPVSGEVVIRPFREDASALEVELAPRAQSFGALDLEFLGTGYLDELPPRWAVPEYELVLQEEGGDRIALKYCDPFRGRQRLEGIPSGIYDVVFQGLGKSVNVVPSESPVRIDPDSTPGVTIELGAFGAIEVELVQADGTSYDSGPIKVSLITETEPGLGLPTYYFLPGPPYVLRHVAPGPHYLWLHTPMELQYMDADSVPRDTVFVTESTVSTAIFVLP